MKLPIKTRILEYALEQNKPFTADDLAEALKDEYPGEKTCQPKNITKQLDTYCGIGVMDAVDVQYDENNTLVVKFAVTDFGKNCEKYIPGHNK